ncbi:uncharacterized protein [Watersipora subatra]
MPTTLFSSPTSTGVISSVSPATIWTSYGGITNTKSSISTIVAVPLVVIVGIVVVACFLIKWYRRKSANRESDEISKQPDVEGMVQFRSQPREPGKIGDSDKSEIHLSAPSLICAELTMDCRALPRSSYNLQEKRNDHVKLPMAAPRNLTVSQYIGHSLSPSLFQSFDDNQRSNSVGSLDPAVNKTYTLSSQDSGFASEQSLPQSPHSPVSCVYFTDASSCHLSTGVTLQKLIDDAIRNFDRIPNKVVGTCYSSRVFAIGEFDSAGGCLQLEGCQEVQLRIPPGALTSKQLVYFMMQFENNDRGDQTVNYSPTFECGPDDLEFKVPVELSFPHSAVDTEVAALSRAKGSVWSETAKDGPEISTATPDMVTLKIHHFTGYKLSASIEPSSRLNRACRSRIPVRPQSTVSTRTPKKRLLMSIFKCGDKARIYFINDSRSARFDKVIDEQEKALHFEKESPWKEFTFVSGKGGLVIEAKKIDSNHKNIYSTFPFNDKKVLSANYEYVEIVSADKPLRLDIEFYQPRDRHNFTQFSVKLEKLPSPSPTHFLLSDEHRLQQLGLIMNSLKLQTPADATIPAESQQNSFLTTARSYGRSVSDVFKYPERQPQEHCDHNGACNCWQNESRSPIEVDTDGFLKQADSLHRGGANRRSKESGYESSVMTPVSPVSPLKGPDTLSGDECSVPEHGTYDLTINSLNI